MIKESNISIRKYTNQDEAILFTLMMREGNEWEGYWNVEGRPKYLKALAGSVTYLIFDGGALCGFARCRQDDGFGIYVYDLLVDKAYRGKGYGRLLMEHVRMDYPDEEAYVMSDVDGYYAKLGYEKAGSIFTIPIKQ